MKHMTKASFLILLLSAALTGCAEKSKGKSTTNNYYSNSSSNSSSSGSGSGSSSGSITGCSDGVARSGATSCYYTNLPRLVFSGENTRTDQIQWSSSTDLPNYIDRDQFSTDATFSVRIRASALVGTETSKQGRTCAGPFLTPYKKVRAYLQLRKAGASSGQVVEVTSTIGSPSTTAKFTVPRGTTEPFILDVKGIVSDYRCTYGSLSTDMKTRCDAGTYFADIPIDNGPYTPCVAFTIEMATDSTYDLP